MCPSFTSGKGARNNICLFFNMNKLYFEHSGKKNIDLWKMGSYHIHLDEQIKVVNFMDSNFKKLFAVPQS